MAGGPILSLSAGKSIQPAVRLLLGMASSIEREALLGFLDRWGYRVEVAEQGAALVASMERNGTPAVLILDAELPGLESTALIHQVQLQSSRRRSWIIVLRRDGGSRVAVSPAREPAIDDVLTLPVAEEDLRTSLLAASRVQARYLEMSEMIEAAQFHASRDTLTGLWTRAAMHTRLFQETDRCQRLRTPLAFVLFDLDHFSRVNRKHGYDGGDAVLRQLASRLRRHLRSYDLTSRSGEDEFMVALPGSTVQDARTLATRLRSTIAERPFDILKTSLRVTASFGIAQSGGRSPLVVWREAEQALARAKLDGRNRVRCFDCREMRFWGGKRAGGAASARDVTPMEPSSMRA